MVGFVVDAEGEWKEERYRSIFVGRDRGGELGGALALCIWYGG